MNRFVFILFFCLNASITFAGPRVNNGGGAWVCNTLDQSKIQWIEILDLSSSIGQSFPAVNQTEWTLYRQKLALIQKQLPKLQSILDRAPLDLQKTIRFLDHSLEVVADAAISAKPSPAQCPNGSISYVQIADFLATGDLVLDGKIWNDKNLSIRSKAALLVHERIYYAFRKALGDMTSYRTQNIVANLFNDSLNTESLQRVIQRSLEKDSNTMSWLHERPVALFSVQLSCTLTILPYRAGFGALKLKYWDNITYGSTNDESVDGFSFHLETGKQDGVPSVMSVQDEKSGFNAIVEGDELATLFLRNRAASVRLENRNIDRTVEMQCTTPGFIDIPE